MACFTSPGQYSSWCVERRARSQYTILTSIRRIIIHKYSVGHHWVSSARGQPNPVRRGDQQISVSEVQNRAHFLATSRELQHRLSVLTFVSLTTKAHRRQHDPCTVRIIACLSSKYVSVFHLGGQQNSVVEAQHFLGSSIDLLSWLLSTVGSKMMAGVTVGYT